MKINKIAFAQKSGGQLTYSRLNKRNGNLEKHNILNYCTMNNIIYGADFHRLLLVCLY